MKCTRAAAAFALGIETDVHLPCREAGEDKGVSPEQVCPPVESRSNSITASAQPSVLSHLPQRERWRSQTPPQGAEFIRDFVFFRRKTIRSLTTCVLPICKGDIQENWVTPWNGPSPHLKYRPQLKTRERKGMAAMQFHVAAFSTDESFLRCWRQQRYIASRRAIARVRTSVNTQTLCFPKHALRFCFTYLLPWQGSRAGSMWVSTTKIPSLPSGQNSKIQHELPKGTSVLRWT